MQPDQPHPRTNLFTVRLWVERFGNDQHEVRIQVRHILSGELRYFRAWPDVVAFLLSKALAPQAESHGEGGDEP